MDSVELAKTPSFRLDGKRALVTGAGRGIGLAAASALAQAGAHVTLIARTQAQIEAAAHALRTRGDKADALKLDVTDLDAVRRAIAGAEPFDVLVNNAGTNRPAHLVDVKIEDFDAIFALNVRAAFFMAQAVARRLIAAKRPGSIINVSSQMGHVGAARRSVYCASKHAMEGFTKAMAIELAPHNIRVNTLGPTFLETPLTKPFFENTAFKSEVLAKIKLGRLGTVEDVLGAIVFLASEASALVTGTSLLGIPPGIVGLLGRLVDGPLRQSQARRDIGENHADACSDADALYHLGWGQLAVRGGKVADDAQGLVLGRFAQLPIEIHQQHHVGRMTLERRLDGMVHLRVGVNGTLALDRHPVGFSAHAPGACGGGWIAQERAGWARLQMEVMGRAMLEVGEVFHLEVIEAEGHSQVLRLDWHGPLPLQPRRMTMAEP